MSNTVLVIGGGISGITAALDLADQGHQVHLVEKEPSIGGRMAQLDKTFPTLDCSICILAPKMVEISRHPNVNLYTWSEVESVKPVKNGKAFHVKILKKPRYVDEQKCTGCRLCTEKCPVKVSSEFDEKMGSRKAIYLSFPQSVPAIAVMDHEHCLYFTKGVCKICEKFCPAGAVDFKQEPQKVELDVAAIVVATGFDLLDPCVISQYGYGRLPNVLTSMEYERLMNAAGPTGGKIVKPSDKAEPEKIAFIQCVGSRNEQVKPYCSQICCTYATKEAVITKEHSPKIDVTIFYNELKISGKGHQEFVGRAAEEFGVNYVRALPSGIQLDMRNGKLEIRYADIHDDAPKSAQVDMIVLCSAVVPKKGSDELAKILGIETTEFGFLKSLSASSPVDTLVPGIYVCGSCEGPKDISHSVAQASAAAASVVLRTEAVQEKVEHRKVPEKAVQKEPRIGVFVCHCGINIGSVVSVPKVVEHARSLDHVTHAEEFLFACANDSLEKIKEAIKKHDLNRVVVASCTPRTHEPLFRSTCEEAGLNPYFFEMINIREHDSWVHSKEPEEATEKASDLVRMGVARARLLRPLQKLEADVTPSALVIGGGVSGLVAAKKIADKGFKVCLLEQDDRLGGRRLSKATSLEGIDMATLIEPLVKTVSKHENIEVLLSAKLKEVRGSIGNYDIVAVQKGQAKAFKVGTIIVATGTMDFQPDGYYGHGKHDQVITLSQLQHLMSQKRLDEKETIVAILCVGAREKEGRTYCSAVCCSEAVDTLLALKKEHPDAEVFILYQDLQVPVECTDDYRQAREEGIIFTRYFPDKPPQVDYDGKKPLVKVKDMATNIDIAIPADKVVLVTPLIPRDTNSDLSSLLKIPLNSQGFFLEAHPKLRPLEFATDGIYVCGTCQSPQNLTECIYQALGAASKALVPLMRGKVSSDATIAEVNSDVCISCANCEAACEYAAIKVEGLTAKVNALLCKGCGVCAVECPSKGITMRHFSDDQISSMIEASLEKMPHKGKPKALAFFCNWCSYAGADMAGVSRFHYPPTAEIIRVMCTGRVDEMHLLQAFLLGADGVLVGGCHIGDCHYISGNVRAEKRVDKVRKWLKEVGLEPERLRLEWISAGEGKKLADVMKDFTEQLEKLGPNPLRGMRKQEECRLTTAS